jgi:hypothetical protein
MVYFREIIPFYGPTIQVSEILYFTHISGSIAKISGWWLVVTGKFGLYTFPIILGME